ncbi:MAG: marine proteobacterial sortase target protein [Pseudomonadota bacterium]
MRTYSIAAAADAGLSIVIRDSGRWLLAGLFIVILALTPAKANEPRLVTPDEATMGALLFESTEPGRYVEAPRLATDVDISVSGPIARTRVTQRFENITDGWVEGIYVFPLPDEAAVDALKMQIGDRFIEGVIEERKKAKAIYEAAKKAGKKASLLEQERPNIFTNSVANIGPGETIVVQIEYQENISLENNEFSLRFPMVVAPRFHPPAVIQNVSLGDNGGWGAADPVPDRARLTPPVLHPDNGPINPVSLRVNINAGFPIGEITSSYHKIAVDRREPDKASLVLSEEETPANRDFELRWTPASGAAPSAALFKELIDGDPYYLLMITPPALDAQAQRPTREVTFVIDTSGSMGGESIRQARDSLALALNRLKAGDAFNVIQFNSVTDQLFARPQPVTDANLRAALRYVARLEATGGTMMLPALKAALRRGIDHNGRLRQVIFLTDGAIGDEQQLFETIAAARGDARIFTVGIGSAPNSFFMSRAAELGQGAFTHIGAVSEVAMRMGALFEKLETPAMTDIAVAWPDGVQAETWPSPIPDLYQGETLIVAARADSERGTLWVSGVEGGQPWKAALPLEGAAARAGVSKLWARKKIASLELARVRPGADREALDKGVLEVALAHSLISRVTSLVAVDVTPSRPAEEEVVSTAVPLNLPAGWDFDKVFGETPAPLQRKASFAPLVRSRLALADTAAAPAGQGVRGVTLPQGATLAGAKMINGAALLLLALTLLIFFRPHAFLWRAKKQRDDE